MTVRRPQLEHHTKRRRRVGCGKPCAQRHPAARGVGQGNDGVLELFEGGKRARGVELARPRLIVERRGAANAMRAGLQQRAHEILRKCAIALEQQRGHTGRHRRGHRRSERHPEPRRDLQAALVPARTRRRREYAGRYARERLLTERRDDDAAGSEDVGLRDARGGRPCPAKPRDVSHRRGGAERLAGVHESPAAIEHGHADADALSPDRAPVGPVHRSAHGDQIRVGSWEIDCALANAHRKPRRRGTVQVGVADPLQIELGRALTAQRHIVRSGTPLPRPHDCRAAGFTGPDALAPCTTPAL